MTPLLVAMPRQKARDILLSRDGYEKLRRLSRAWMEEYCAKGSDSLDLKTLRSILNAVQSRVAVLRQQSLVPFAVAYAAFGAFAFAYFFFA